MTFTHSCEACGQSIAFEYGTGDRSGLCWREECRRRRRERLEALERARFDREWRARVARVYPLKGAANV